MANQEQLAILRQGVKVWNGWRNENPKTIPDLSNIDLSNTDLSNTNLSQVDLTGTNLSDAILTATELRESNLTRTDLTRANLSGVDLSKAILRYANLDQTDLSLAKLTDADLSEAKLRGVNFNGTILTGVDLNNTDLSQVNISEAIFRIKELPSEQSSTLFKNNLEKRWRNDSFNLSISCFIFAILFIIFSILIVQVYENIVNGLAFNVFNSWTSKLRENQPIELIIFCLCAPFIMWLSLRFLVSKVLIAFHCFNQNVRRFSSWIVRFLAAVPTLILGSILMIIVEELRVYIPKQIFPFLLFLLLIFVTLPTALQISIPILEDYEKKHPEQQYAALALGSTKMEVAEFILVPSISGIVKMGTTIAIGRVAIEGFIALNNSNILSKTQSMRKILSILYSQTMIENNIVLIIALLLFSVVTIINLYGVISYFRI